MFNRPLTYDEMAAKNIDWNGYADKDITSYQERQYCECSAWADGHPSQHHPNCIHYFNGNISNP